MIWFVVVRLVYGSDKESIDIVCDDCTLLELLTSMIVKLVLFLTVVWAFVCSY